MHLLPQSFEVAKTPLLLPGVFAKNNSTPPPSCCSVLLESLPHLLPRQAFRFLGVSHCIFSRIEGAGRCSPGLDGLAPSDARVSSLYGLPHPFAPRRAGRGQRMGVEASRRPMSRRLWSGRRCRPSRGNAESGWRPKVTTRRTDDCCMLGSWASWPVAEPCCRGPYRGPDRRRPDGDPGTIGGPAWPIADGQRQ